MKLFTGMLLALTLASTVLASPGAHGPNGEHLDAPANAGSGAEVPRLETFSEMFELVAQLSGGELSVMVDRYETNEPVLGGRLEVEYKGLKAPATFHADMGDYAIDDKALLKALSAPGKHALIFTFIAGEESDLLEGTLEVGAPRDGHDDHDSHGSWPRSISVALAAAVLAALALVVRYRRRRTTP